jgi:hypothetical protein
MQAFNIILKGYFRVFRVIEFSVMDANIIEVK